MRLLVCPFLSLLAVATGCSPASTAVKIGMHVVGKVVADEEVKKLSDKLVGRQPAAADAQLGQPIDVWRDVSGGREWRTYAVPMDVLGKKRYVVGVSSNQIGAVEMIEAGGEETDIPLELYYLAKVKGKTPSECTAALGFGPPLLAVRSTRTNQLMQMYDARMIKELPKAHNCIVRFDPNNRCAKVDLVEVEASNGAQY